VTQLGDYGRAAVLGARSVAILRGALGPFHPEVAEALRTLADAQERQGDLPAAERSLREAITVLDSVAGPRHPRTASVRYSLGRTLTTMGRYQEALDELALAHAMDAASGDEATRQLVRLQMAHVRLRLGQPAVAESLAAEVERALRPDSVADPNRTLLADLRAELARSR
jgi:tetratricopeptide (TPR) repeat protein